MKRSSLFRKILSAVFAAAIVFTVSVREVHYLFSLHEAHEHCENHLHSENQHEDCSICKFDVSFFTDEIVCEEQIAVFHAKTLNDYFYLSPVSFYKGSSVSLRGPPALV